MRALLSLTLLFLVGCASMEVLSDHDPEVDFSAFHSFAHASPPPPASRRNRRLPNYNTITARRIQGLIGAELKAKGLRETPPQEADLIVIFSVHGQQRRQVVGGGGGRWGGGGSFTTTHYVHGTLTIDMFERRRRLHVWQGWANKDLFGDEEARKAEGEAIRKILAQYPPKP